MHSAALRIRLLKLRLAVTWCTERARERSERIFPDENECGRGVAFIRLSDLQVKPEELLASREGRE